MPVYNGQRYVAQCIESILGQSFADFEVIISDNASTDGTFAICSAYAARDRRIRLYRESENRGGGWNHNRVLELATGRYFKWACHDDLCDRSMLAKCVAALGEDPGVVLAHPRTTIIDEAGLPVENYALELRTASPDVTIRFGDLVTAYHNCYQIYGVIRRSALDRTGPMGNFVNGDGVLLANLALYGTFYTVPEYLFFSRRHSAQSSQIPPMRLKQRRFRLTGRVNGMPPIEWWDPSRRRSLTFPQWRQLREYIRMVGRSDLGVSDRTRCRLVILRWVLKDHRRYVKDLVIAADQLLCNLSTLIERSPLSDAGESL
jgi:glycosyltransferase involved in cell wall biosynthesis